MCGILGAVDYANKVEKSIVQKATDLMARRGPDAFGLEMITGLKANIFLSHRRLSIIDLSDCATQPLYSLDRKWVIIFNGEIYNYAEIRKLLVQRGYQFKSNSDTEVILNGFECWGPECVSRFIGMFAFGIINLELQKLFVFRDRTGVKPLYYYADDDLFCFSSDLDSIGVLIDDKKQMDVTAIPAFVKYGYIGPGQSFLTGVHKLQPGHFISYDLTHKKFTTELYWDPMASLGLPKKKILSVENVCEELESLLASAFDYRMVADVPVGVFLSGGYDSSLVAAILSKKLNYNVRSYTIGFKEDAWDESRYAKQVAEELGLDHTEYICSESDAQEIIPLLVDVYDEPFGDSSSIPTLLVSRLAARDVKVVLSADGGDEIFGGYHKYTNALTNYPRWNRMPGMVKNILKNTPTQVLGKMISPLAGKRLNRSHLDKLTGLFNAGSPVEFADILSGQNTDSLYKKEVNPDFLNASFTYGSGFDRIRKLKDPLDQMLVLDYLFYLEGDILKKVDRATMYHSIEGREPLLDHRIYEFMAGLPSELKITKDHQKKYLLKKITHKYLPEQMMNRPKMGFSIPIHKWFSVKGHLQDLFFDYLTDERMNRLGIFDLKKINEMKNQYLKDGASHFELLWYLFNLNRWYEKNFL